MQSGLVILASGTGLLHHSSFVASSHVAIRSVSVARNLSWGHSRPFLSSHPFSLSSSLFLILTLSSFFLSFPTSPRKKVQVGALCGLGVLQAPPAGWGAKPGGKRIFTYLGHPSECPPRLRLCNLTFIVWRGGTFHTERIVWYVGKFHEH